MGKLSKRAKGDATPSTVRKKKSGTRISSKGDRTVSLSPPPVPSKLDGKKTSQPSIKPITSNVRSLSDSIHDIAATVLFETGFARTAIDKSEIVEILRFLEDCREEGRALYPEILLTTDLRKCLQGVHPLRVVMSGESEDRPGRFRRALKKCASIASEPWVVVLEVNKFKVSYGFASANVRADSISLYEAVIEARSTEEDCPPFLFFRRFGSRAVWLKSLKTEQVISLTLSGELLVTAEHVSSFVRIVVENLQDPIRDKTFRLVSRLIQEACREGHGFIACAVDSDSAAVDECKRSFSDASWLVPPLSLAAPPVDPENAADALQSDSTLRAGAALARKMVAMDLMTMFSTEAAILGYNIHISSPNAANVTGGARTKAFAALRTKPSLRAVFMCSQDGETRFEEFPHATA